MNGHADQGRKEGDGVSGGATAESTGPTTETEFVGALADALADDLLTAHAAVRTFSEAMVLTDSQGLVVRFPDGPEYQVSVVRSR